MLNMQCITTVLCNIAFGIAIVTFINYLWNRRWLYYYSWNVPGPKTLPIIGNALEFVGSSKEIYQHFHYLNNKYGPFYRLWLGSKLYFFLMEPNAAEIVSKTFLEKDEIYDSSKIALGDGLVTAKVKIWKNHRKVILSNFKQKKLDSFINVFWEKSMNFINELELYTEGNYFDVHPILQRTTLDIIAETILDIKLDKNGKNRELINIIQRATQLIFLRLWKIWYHIDFIWNRTIFAKELKLIIDKYQEILKQKINEKKEALKENQKQMTEEECAKSFLDNIIAEGIIWSDKEILDEVATLTFAGSDTSANTDAFVLIILGMYDDIQEKAYQEQYSIFGDSIRKVTPEDLKKMTYLERIIKETLRLFPIAPFLARKIQHDLNLKSIFLPKGSTCIIPIFGLHYNPCLWHNPKKFDPDRFSPEEISKRHASSYIPFSVGYRNCIGRTYAMMTMKILLSTVIRFYKIKSQLADVSDIQVQMDIVLTSADGFYIALKRRSSKFTNKFEQS